MRKVIDLQMKLHEKHIGDIKFDLKSRDEIPKLLKGLQYIFCDHEIRSEVFDILEEMIPKGTDMANGRPGMHLWRILVLGTLRLICNWDYDKVKEIADHHDTVREMLGHESFDKSLYPLQTIKDNISLFTWEIIDKINVVVVKAGHKFVSKKNEEIVLKGKCDSFVAKTNVDFPTDANILFDAVRKMIILIAALCAAFGIKEWRQFDITIKKLKKLFNYVRKLKASTSQDEKKKADKKESIKEAYRSLINYAEKYVEKAKAAVKVLLPAGAAKEKIEKIEKFIKHAEKQIDQIRRRIIEDKTIPHIEKVFSIFEEHTEWIVKGKSGVPQELGVKVCIVEDQYGFILHNKVMEQVTDVETAIQIVRETLERYKNLTSCSFDKGFWSITNFEELEKILNVVILPKKGKLSETDKEREESEEFVEGRREHPAVESAINALQNHGLDRCPDHGIKGFKRYAALAVLARNIQILGNKIHQKELKTQKRKEKYRITWQNNYKLAA